MRSAAWGAGRVMGGGREAPICQALGAGRANWAAGRAGPAGSLQEGPRSHGRACMAHPGPLLLSRGVASCKPCRRKGLMRSERWGRPQRALRSPAALLSLIICRAPGRPPAHPTPPTRRPEPPRHPPHLPGPYRPQALLHTRARGPPLNMSAAATGTPLLALLRRLEAQNIWRISHGVLGLQQQQPHQGFASAAAEAAAGEGRAGGPAGRRARQGCKGAGRERRAAVGGQLTGDTHLRRSSESLCSLSTG